MKGSISFSQFSSICPSLAQTSFHRPLAYWPHRNTSIAARSPVNDGNTDEGLNLMQGSFLGSATVVELEVVGSDVELEGRGGGESLIGEGWGGGIRSEGESASQGHGVEPFSVIEVVVNERLKTSDEVVGVTGTVIVGMEVVVGPGETKARAVVVGGLPENGVKLELGLGLK